MSDKKHIDRLFQEKFKDFEVGPNEALWNRIENDLPKKQKKRRTVLLWWQLGGVAAVVLLLLTVGISIFKPENKSQLPVVDTDIDKVDSLNSKEKNILRPSSQEIQKSLVDGEADSLEPNPSIINNEIDNSNRVANSSSTKKNTSNPTVKSRVTLSSDGEATVKVASNSVKKESSKNQSILLNTKDANEQLKEAIAANKNAIASSSKETQTNTNQETKEDTTIDSDLDINEEIKKQSIQEAIAEQEDLINEKEKDEQSRWSIAPNVAPVYFSSMGQGSPVDAQFNENSKGSNISMSYGISGSYALSNRVKVRIGVNSVNLNQTTADVFAFNGADIGGASRMARMDNVDYKGGTNSYAVMNSAMMSRMPSPESFNSSLSGELEQRFGFIEVPMELEYRVLDKKFGVNVIGGFSTLFLNNNELYADVQGTTTLIGEATNINSTSFSANFGLGMDYSLSDKWKINLEPMFKYQINTFTNTSGEFRPFFIGVYSGLSFKF